MKYKLRLHVICNSDIRSINLNDVTLVDCDDQNAYKIFEKNNNYIRRLYDDYNYVRFFSAVSEMSICRNVYSNNPRGDYQCTDAFGTYYNPKTGMIELRYL